MVSQILPLLRMLLLSDTGRIVPILLTLLTSRLHADGPGRWVLGPNSQALAVNASVLKNGKVLYFGGSQHDPFTPWGIDATYIYDPVDGTVTKITSPSTDIFCSGHAQMADGRIAVVG